MEELIQKISDKTGISVDQAKGAVETMLEHFKEKLPSGIGEKLESFVQGGSAEAGDFITGLKEKIGGFFS